MAKRMIQAEKDPTDHVWISYTHKGQDNKKGCYGAMRRADPAIRDVEEFEYHVSEANMTGAEVPNTDASSSSAGNVELQAQRTQDRISELARMIAEEHEKNPDRVSGTETLKPARIILEYSQHREHVHEPQGGEGGDALAGLRNNGSGVGGSTHEEATDTPDTPVRKRARTDSGKSTTVTDPTQGNGKF